MASPATGYQLVVLQAGNALVWNMLLHQRRMDFLSFHML